MIQEHFFKAREFMILNARPIDLARWHLHFEYGTIKEVLIALKTFQNPDGGFGHALEPDSWNPHSSPIQTWSAMEIMEEIGLDDPKHPMIQGILTYLESTPDFDGHFWFNTVPSNTDYPHAPWWQDKSKKGDYHDYNPTAYFAGFILRFAERHSNLYQTGKRIAQESILAFNQTHDTTEMHLLACFAHLAQDLQSSGITDLVGFDTMELHLIERIKTLIDQDKDHWTSGYVCKPSRFIKTRNSPLYPIYHDAAEAECVHIEETQAEDGTWAVTWDWAEYPREWAIAKNWWKSIIILNNLLYLKQFGRLTQEFFEPKTLDGS